VRCTAGWRHPPPRAAEPTIELFHRDVLTAHADDTVAAVARRTRLIQRTRCRLTIDPSLLWWPLFDVVDIVLQPKVPRAIRQRVAATA
jgi:hypothetical protein